MARGRFTPADAAIVQAITALNFNDPEKARAILLAVLTDKYEEQKGKLNVIATA